MTVAARVLITPRDTAGEKAAEIFVGRGESAKPWLPGLDLVQSTPRPEKVQAFLHWSEAARLERDGPSVEEICRRMEQAVPEFQHVTGQRRLDDRI